MPESTVSIPKESDRPRGSGLTNPHLSASLRADYDALQNDLAQANELAADFQRQLAGKSNEFAELKRLFAKTQTDLGHFQKNITELRQERHRLANEAMRATAYEIKLKDLTAERNRLQIEVDALRHSQNLEAQDNARVSRERFTQIAQLTLELEALKAHVANSRSAPNAPVPSRSSGPEVQAAVATLHTAVQQLMKALDIQPEGAGIPKPEATEGFIDISYDR